MQDRYHYHSFSIFSIYYVEQTKEYCLSIFCRGGSFIFPIPEKSVDIFLLEWKILKFTVSTRQDLVSHLSMHDHILLSICVYSEGFLKGNQQFAYSFSLMNKHQFSESHSDLYDVLARIEKFAKTELDLYKREKLRNKS